jgi:hypothetical protein
MGRCQGFEVAAGSGTIMVHELAPTAAARTDAYALYL